MITRIVKMEFHPHHAPEFLALSQQIHPTIRQFPGCHHLQIYRDAHQPHIFFSYSHWQTEEHLNQYRRSEFFRQTWAHTKTLFAAPPQAWTLQSFIPTPPTQP